MSNEITNNEDVIDSRQVIERIAELEAREDDEDDPLNDDEAEELRKLRELAKEAGDYATYGETLIRDSYFETYARELAEETGAVSGEERWPLTCIDWEQAAEELRMDYTAVEFDGETYWVR